MPSDITTVEEVQAGEYTVRVAHADGDVQGYEAVVIDDSGGDSPVQRSPLGLPLMAASMSGTDDSDDEDVTAPPVAAPHKWVAVGLAIEAYEWAQVNENPVGVGEAYQQFSSDADIELTDNLDSVLMGMGNDIGTQTFTGSFTLDTDDE